MVGGIGTLVGVLGLILTVSFYFGTRKTRELTYYLHPARTAIVKTGQISALKILYRNQEIKTDVTAVQIAIWNRGKEAIKAEHVLTPIEIATKPGVPILETRILRASREHVSRFTVDVSRQSEGIVPVSWRILELDDGAVVQLTYAGSADTEIVITGVIEGQRKISSARRGWFPVPFLASVILGATVGATISWLVNSILQPRVKWRGLRDAGALFTLALVMALWFLLRRYFTSPDTITPFGF